MARWRERCVCIKFCFRVGQNAAQTFEMLKETFGEETGRTQFFEWISKCKNVGPMLTMPDVQFIHEHARHENVDQVREILIEQNCYA